jgi:Bifunctional DNA primase/polymerase, N-terminal
MNALLDAALCYATRGIPVYPVHWPRRIPGGASLACSCSRGPVCDRPAKHPLVRHGVNDAACEVAELERWWRRWPAANIGLATGICFDALDVDGPAGMAALRRLIRTAGLRLPGPVVATGGGADYATATPAEAVA